MGRLISESYTMRMANHSDSGATLLPILATRDLIETIGAGLINRATATSYLEEFCDFHGLLIVDHCNRAAVQLTKLSILYALNPELCTRGPTLIRVAHRIMRNYLLRPEHMFLEMMGGRHPEAVCSYEFDAVRMAAAVRNDVTFHPFADLLRRGFDHCNHPMVHTSTATIAVHPGAVTRQADITVTDIRESGLYQHISEDDLCCSNDECTCSRDTASQDSLPKPKTATAVYTTVAPNAPRRTQNRRRVEPEPEAAAPTIVTRSMTKRRSGAPTAEQE